MKTAVLFILLLIIFAGCIHIGDDMTKKDKQTTITGVYSEKYKGGPVIETNDGAVVYLTNFQQDSKYEGKTIEVTGFLFEDTEHVVGPYKPGEPISQGWASPRSVMNVSSFKVIK